MSKDKAKPSFGRSLWDFLASVKLALILLLALAVFSIIGTIVPQNQPEAFYHSYFGAFAATALKLGLNDTYHAPWFLFLLAMLAANLVICSIERLPLTLRLMRSDPAKELSKARKPNIELDLPVDAASAVAKAEKLLVPFGAVHKAADGGKTTLFAQKGAWSRLGVYVVHMSVLIIFIGAIIGLIVGFDGTMRIPQGKQADVVALESGGGHKLPFSVRLDKFNIDYYDTGQVSEYRSKLTFVQDGKDVLTRDIIVNDPAGFGGIDFYQSFYGYDLTKVKLMIKDGDAAVSADIAAGGTVDLPGGVSVSLRVSPALRDKGPNYKGEWARVMLSLPNAGPRSMALFGPGSGRKSVSAVISDLQTTEDERAVYVQKLEVTIDGMGQPFKVTFSPKGEARQMLPGGGHVWLADFNPMLNMGMFYQGPMVRLGLHAPGSEPMDLVAFKTKDPASAPPQVEIIAADMTPFTGLSAKYDPGVWFVFIGCGLMVAGFIIAFYFAHRKVWIVVSPAKGSCHVAIAGGSNKNKAGLKLMLGKLADNLRAQTEGGSE